MRTAITVEMSEAIEPGLELLERQNRFVSEHLRRIFVQIYRIVGNVADAQDLTQEAFIKALVIIYSLEGEPIRRGYVMVVGFFQIGLMGRILGIVFVWRER